MAVLSYKKKKDIPSYQPIPKVQPQGKIEVKGEADGSPDKKKKLDLSDALKLRLTKHWTYQEIGAKYDMSKQAVHDALKPFHDLIQDPEAIQAYQANKAQILTSIEMELAKQLLDVDKLKAASLNNLAYSFQGVYNAGRLERGASTQNISIAGRFMMLQGEAED